ncbi:MAG TPA: CHRD domain-containing protein [Vicinamibacterales bacterium]|nr:CHRD domain-containing protein [Vicinamibacterales bacterium]
MRASLNRIMVGSVAAGLLWCLAGSSPSAAEKYLVYLSPMPFSDATQPNMTGKGSGSATLENDTLSISAAFSGLASAATKGHLSLSKAAGIPGAPLFDLTVSNDVTGKVTGQLKLDPAQLAGLRGGKLYVQIDSEKAPTGNLWGWLLQDHEIAGQDVPQKGPWFIPPFAVKTK